MVRFFADIKRYPPQEAESLQSWDSADELLLDHLDGLDLHKKRLLIINDHFGALSCHLQHLDITTYTDSFVSAKAILANSKQQITALNNFTELAGCYDYVLIQLPKNMSYFEDMLCHITNHLDSNSQIICCSMVKHLAPASFDLLQKYIGPTTTSLAKKKARLIFSNFIRGKVVSPYPKNLHLDGFDFEFANNSNLFSREKLDIGTRFFLEHLPKEEYQKILDLGCANGIIGIKAKLLNPSATITFSDESSMAIQSAKINYLRYFKDQASFHWVNCFEDHSLGRFDLVLCNPPFHQQSMVGDFIAAQMFRDAWAVLTPGGALRVIGNSHLGYHLKLKRLFGKSSIVATNDKFMICEAIK